MPDDKDRDQTAAEWLDRRRFLNRVWKFLAAGLALEAGWTTFDILTPRLAGTFGGVLRAGAADAFAEGTVTYVGEGRFYMTRLEGELAALWQKCPHLGCRVPFCERSGRFECPCHGSVFNRKGEYLEGPAPRGMDSFPVRVEDGVVLVDTGNVVEGPPQGRLTLHDEPSGPSCLESVEGDPGEPAR